MKQKIKKAIPVLFLWLSPLLKLTASSIDAISDGYDERFVTDPGHKFIKITDALILILSWVVFGVVVYVSNNYYGNFESESSIITFGILFFPYLYSKYITGLLYGTLIVLGIYNNKRQAIIRKINECKGVW